MSSPILFVTLAVAGVVVAQLRGLLPEPDCACSRFRGQECSICADDRLFGAAAGSDWRAGNG